MTSNVYLFVPNVIGYVRIALLALSVPLFAHGVWHVAIGAYLVAQLLDIADGMAARRFGQVSQFGAVLDQVTDRMSTAAIMMVAASLYPHYLTVIIALAIADLAGHWFHTIGSLVSGKTNHKDIPNGWRLLSWYYKAPYAMLACHGGNEAVWLLLCILPYIPPYVHTPAMIVLCLNAPLCILKAVTNVLQGMLGAHCLVEAHNRRS
eukprot:GHVO01006206.1.p1 GENE.GHVO01006206.1~~GHVO01006206.1.p1  ORF type:complete len:213 (-),score=26.00 GHVO01006206.1:266-883(-)